MSSFRVFCVFFAEGVQDVNGVLELCHIENTPFAQDMHPDFKSPRADGRHGLEVGRAQTTLYLPQLETRSAPRFQRKIRQVVQTTADEFKRFHGDP
jgi:hypothetical protein